MKWSVVGLLFFGIVAALCAAVLVASMRGGAPARPAGDVTCLVAAKALPERKIIDPDSIAEKTIPAKDAPEGYITNPYLLINKVLATPLAEGKPFTRSCFATDVKGFRVPAILPQGMRAVTLSLNDSAGLYGILYAGCTVDVLASFRLQSGGNEAVAMPLLQDVQVLAVEGDTLVSSGQPATEGKKSESSKKLLVTVMVNLEQAATLQLATQYGNVSLAVRNPKDRAALSSGGTLLSGLTRRESGGGAVGLESSFAARMAALGGILSGKEAGTPGNAIAKAIADAKTEDGGDEEKPQPAPAAAAKDKPAEPAADLSWKVVVNKGGEKTFVVFPQAKE